MQFKINLATRTYINKKNANRALGATIAILFIFLLVQVRAYSRNAGEISRIESFRKTDEARFKNNYPNFSQKDYTKLTDDIKFCNGLIRRKTYDWVGLLNRLENVVPAGLTLTSLEPDSEHDSLKIAGKALDFAVMSRFIENLEASDSFSEVYLFKQAENENQDSQKLISFTISCKYKL